MFYRERNYQLLFLIIGSLSWSSLYAADKERKVAIYNMIKEGTIGGIAGGLEPLATQPLINLKILEQQQDKNSRGTLPNGKNLREILPMVRANPKILYRGLPIHIVSAAPATSVQIGFEGIVKEKIPSDDFCSVTARNTILGCFSALTCNGTEFVIARQNGVSHSAIQIIKKLHKDHGPAVFARGFLAKAARDSIYCTGFLTYYPYMKAIIENYLNSCNGTGSLSVLNGPLTTIMASCIVGIPTAIVSHPFDTLSTRLQSDLGNKDIVGYRDVVNLARKEKEGLVSFLYRGCRTRATLITVAIPLITSLKDALTIAMQKNN